MQTLNNGESMGTIRTKINDNFAEHSADIANCPTNTELTSALSLKVDKDGTKVLSDNNFTDDQVANLTTAYDHSQAAHAATNALVPGDVVNDLTSGGTAVPLSAEQGKTLATTRVILDPTGTAAANAANVNTFRVVTVADVGDLQICLQTGVDTYAWHSITATEV